MKHVLGVLMLLVGLTASASEVWVLTGSARGAEHDCEPVYSWNTDVILHNTSIEVVLVRALGFSNGAGQGQPFAITIDPEMSVQLRTTLPRPSAPLFVTKLDVPAEVRVESRLEYRYDNPCILVPPVPGPAGKTLLPVFEELIPAGERQIHTGSDLGLQSSRINVGIYNGGAAPATAVIEVRRPACASSTTGRTEVTIPPDTLIQTTAAGATACDGAADLRVPSYVTYTVVTVDQPSFSYAVAVSNVQSPNVSVSLAGRD